MRARMLLGLTAGELTVVVFVTTAVLSFRYWPRVGAWVGATVARGTRHLRQ
jgi:hypothetical protein